MQAPVLPSRKQTVINPQKKTKTNNDFRCQLVKRLGKIYEAVAANCNTAWERKYGDMVNYLIANNQAGYAGAACEPVVYLP